MKILNLDLKSKNKNIGQVEKCDTVKLITTLEEGDYSKALIRIIGKKADKTFVEQFVQATNNKIEVTLNKQFTSCEGITRLEINIVTDEEEWTSNENYFYISSTLNSNIIESINDVKTLNDLDHYLIYAKQEIINIKTELETVSMDKLLEIKRLLEIENTNANENIESLKALILQAIDIKNKLNSSINTANDSNLELKNTTTQANTSKELLENTTNTANASKKALDGSITSANNIDRTLKETTTIATTLKSNLEKVINVANTSKTNLENTTAAANTKKTELDKSITNATSKITEITNKNTEATTNINTLKSKITEANTCKTNLDTSIEEGQATKTAIDEAIVNGDLEKTNAQLLEMTQEIKEARVDYFGKEHSTLKEKEDREFEFVHIDNSKGMFVESSTNTAHVKIDNSIEGRARDSVIKGRTLQNLGGFKEHRFNSNDNRIKSFLPVYNLDPNGDYYLSLDVDIKNNVSLDNNLKIYYFANNTPFGYYSSEINKSGKYIIKLKNLNFNGDSHPIVEVRMYYEIQAINDGLDVIIKNTMLFNTELRDINYFEGIKSLGEEDGNKISILSTGKNLFDFNSQQWKKGSHWSSGYGESRGIYIENNSLKLTLTASCVGTEIKLKPNTKYYVGCRIKNTSTMIVNSSNLGVVNKVTISSPTGIVKFGIGVYDNNTNNGYVLIDNIYVIEGEAATEYEPYKSDKKDILLPVEFGAKGFENGVADEVLPNGDYLQKIERIILNGIRGWNEYGSSEKTCMFYIDLNTLQSPQHITNIVCDNFVGKDVWGSDTEGIFSNPTPRLFIRILKAKLETQNVAGFKKWLQQNPTTVYYQLAEPILHKAEVPTNDNFATFKDITHVTCLNKIAPSSMSGKFPVNIAATISRLNVENKGLLEDNVELKNKAENLLVENELQQLEIDISMNATVELFEMMLQTSIYANKTVRGDSMVEVYVSLILKGKKKLEDVPAIIRPQVEQMLIDLGVLQ